MPEHKKGGKKNRKFGRHSRKPSARLQRERSALNKLKRINHARAKSGLPPLLVLPAHCRDRRASS